jgi:hypothetical protein
MKWHYLEGEERMKVNTFAKLKKAGKIFLDPSFQVGTPTHSRWDYKLQKAYIVSILKGSAPTPIIVVNIKKALKYHEDMGIDDISIEYFRDLLKRKYTWVSVDGNNRSIAVINFIDSKFNLPRMTVPTKYGNIKVVGTKAKYETMNDKLRETFDDSIIPVCEYTEISRKECNELFLCVNSGDALNAQHKRNSWYSKVADYVRAVRKEYESTFSMFIDKQQLHGAMAADAFIAKCISYATYNKETKKSSLDDVYHHPELSAAVVKPVRYFESKTPSSDFHWVMSNGLKDLKGLKSLVNLKNSLNSIFDYFAILLDFKKENIKIIDRPKFTKRWLEVSGSMFADEDKSYKSMDNKESYTYKTLVKKSQDIELGNYRRALLKDAIGDDFLSFQEDADILFTKEEKVIMWQRQDGKSKLTGKDIPFEEIDDWTKWQGDAIIPKNKEGRHILSNGQLIEADINREKSDKLNYTHKEII